MYRSPNIVRVIKSRRLRWAGHVARMEEGRSAFKILTGKPTRKRQLKRLSRRWEDNITMDLKEISIIARNWVDSAQDRDHWRALVNVALNFVFRGLTLVVFTRIWRRRSISSLRHAAVWLLGNAVLLFRVFEANSFCHFRTK